jgi:hypothetical protein
MSAERLALLACGLCLGVPVLVAGAEPDPEFIEYLGMWDETDEDWQLLDEVQAAEIEERRDSEPEGEESAEKSDES